MDDLIFNLTDDIKLELVWICAGTFMMGSPEDESGRKNNEKLHKVTLSKDFWIGKYSVTQEQYIAIMNENPSFRDDGGKYPLEGVPWEDAMTFCKRLTERVRNAGQLLPDGYEFSLPTEAQWEYACRAGTKTAYNFGDSIDKMKAKDDYNDLTHHPRRINKSDMTKKVGSYQPNAWGLYDMHGNVWEWCRDNCECDDDLEVITDTYRDGVVDPYCSKGLCYIMRGGSWAASAVECRAASRDCYNPVDDITYQGFRVAIVPVL